MIPRSIQHILLILLITLLPLAKAQLSASNLPQCMQQCISSSDDENCSATDIACLCRASSGNFLPNLVTCMHWQCSDSVLSDVSLLLTPLQIACSLAGAPIPSAAIRNAQSIASSLDNQVTTTVTMGRSSATGSAQATTTVPSLSITTTTTTTTRDGTTVVLVFPITIGRTTTSTGVPSTVSVTATSISTSISSRRTVTITNSRGSSIGGIATSSTRVLTTTNSVGSTITTTQGGSSFSTSSSHASSSHSSSTHSSSSNSGAAGQGTSTTVNGSGGSSPSATSSRTSSAPAESETNSSPFLNTNNPACRSEVSNWLMMLGVPIGMMGYLWV